MSNTVPRTQHQVPRRQARFDSVRNMDCEGFPISILELGFRSSNSCAVGE